MVKYTYMGFARVESAQPTLLGGRTVSIETDLSAGLFSFAIVGLPDKAVEEARDRVCAAIKHSGFPSPKSDNRRVVVSLAPAELKKEGAYFDVPIALSYLLSAEAIRFSPQDKWFVGELALNGDVRPVRGALAIARAAREAGIRELYVPAPNAREAALIGDLSVFPVATLKDLALHLNERDEFTLSAASPTPYEPDTVMAPVDLSDIRGQEAAKRGIEIAAAGRHNIVLTGPPGTGKTMLARALQGIMPALTFQEALEVTAIHSVAGTLGDDLVTLPPFRAPHHTASYVALVGGGVSPRPGEITLAHRGILFLDEFPEFDRRTIDALREPLENRTVSVARAKGSVQFPASFVLVAALNPHRGRAGEDTPETYRERERTFKKISGPIIDRIDMWIEVGHVDVATLSGSARSTPASKTVRERVIAAREKQYARLGEGRVNSDMQVRDIESHAALSPSAQTILETAAGKHNLSPRSYHRLIKLARTIADLEGSDAIGDAHILEALQYRPQLNLS